MEFPFALGVVAVVHGVLFFFDSFFKSCAHHPYDAFLNGTGLTIKFLRIDWYTTAFNRKILSWSTTWSRLCRLSFDLGASACVLLVPVTFCTLIYLVCNLFRGTTDASQTVGPVQVEILIPGVTLPKDELLFYVITLLLCTIVHEVGHAIASYGEDVPLNGFGLRLLFILPMAYADISTDALERLRNWRKLRIFCAGVWHNIILGSMGYLLFLALPLFLVPFFSNSAGVYILNVDPNSPIGGPRGLQPGDVLMKINKVTVREDNTFHNALVESLRDKPKYCVTSDFVHSNDESRKVETVNGVVECCGPDAKENLCFEHFIENGILEMPPLMCLHVRRLIESSEGLCDEQESCSPGFYCVKPLLDNRTTIMQIKRGAGGEMLYLGHPGDIYQTTKWSSYVPKTRFISPRVPEAMLLFLKYVTVFSFGLAFINLLPCYGFDGQYIVQTLAQQISTKAGRNSRTGEVIATILTMSGTAFLFLLVGDFLKQKLL